MVCMSYIANKKMEDASKEFLSSRQNPRVKALIKLQSRAGRRKLGVFLVEGLREASRCAELVGLEELYYCPEFFKAEEHSEFVEKILAGGVAACRLSESVFEKVSNREGCDGILGVAKQWGCLLEDLQLSENPLVLLADAIEKPGNLGALIRSADSVGADALVLTNPVSDIFNPAVVRASQGALFSLPIALSSPSEAHSWLKKNSIAVYGAHLGAKKNLWQTDMKKPSAIVMGSEKDGLGRDWESLLDEKIKIPMTGISDSMNVNVAASICLYEALRQRNL